MVVTTLHDPGWRGFASDNYAGVHPQVLAALAAANGGHQVSYGEDRYTARLQEVIKDHFGGQAEAFPVFNGTGANVVALTAVLPRWGAVVTTTNSHIHNDECGAPERIGGIKLLPVPTPDGKLTPDLVAREAWGWGDEHRAQPLAVSITQNTEVGTVYSPEQVRAVADFAHAHGMAVHMDGARLWNAAAALGAPLRAFTTDAGVDVLSLGGTKNGLLGAEAVVVLAPERVSDLRFVRKMTMQLASKMRFASVQLLALFEDDLGLRAAAHANAMAARLRAALGAEALPGLAFTQPTEANAVFATLPTDAADRIRERVRFYDWDRARGEVRWMTAWDTTEADVDAFVAVVREELADGPGAPGAGA
ncbi:L-threonine aldolase [Pseudonocardia thermophila]|uniref:L-threonine aldolase n=1 Tax=Pseudonocardia thermophila TaxID=1848 RepID=A0A1M6ZV36_PSETH|nr:beta-eliminating lyase-related protein [Pseudonocardia thermophila]SHL34266.1 L-threonine aldolase [Pseudonocardia thermophila]